MSQSPDIDYGPTLEAATWTLTAVSFLFISLRFWARIYKSAVGIDDGVMLLSWLLFLSSTIIFHFVAITGGTRHVQYLTVDEVEYQWKLIIINLPIAIATTATGKIAIGFTILRIFGNTSPRKKWSVWIMLIVLTVVSLFDIFLALFRCGAPSTQWNLVKLAATDCAISSLAYYRFNYFTIAVQTFSDYYFSVLPMFVVWNLKMKRRQRITIVFLLGLTLITGVLATIKLVIQARLSATDITGDVFPIGLMFSLEAMFIIVFGSMPVLKPIWELCLSIRQAARRNGSLGQSTQLSRAFPNKQIVVIETKYDRAPTKDNRWLQAGDMEIARLAGYPAQPAAVYQGGEEPQSEKWTVRRVQRQTYVHQQLYQEDIQHHKAIFELPG